MRCHPYDMHLSGSNLDEEKIVIRYQPTPSLDLGGEEVNCHQHIHVHADELLSGGHVLALRGWWDAMAFQNAADHLIAHGVAQVG
jgi:hypothetical protein